eukprot:PhM_4_TR18655/c0_g1_i3/m.75758
MISSPPGWFHDDGHLVPQKCRLSVGPIKGVVLTALCDIPTGGLICRDEALLTVFSNPDMFLRTPLATYLNTLLRQYGDVVLHEGHAFVLCSFLLEAKKYPRDTDNPIWDLVRERTPGA